MSELPATKTYSGGCHCGRIRYEVTGALDHVEECNCSICAKKGYSHWIVPRDSFRLLTPEHELATYSFNTGIAKHIFCGTCGVAPYYIPRSDPDKIDVNARCLEGVNVRLLPCEYFDGQNWEENVESYKQRRDRAAGDGDKSVMTLGFSRGDFEVFSIEGFSPRMQKIYELVRPRLVKLGNELAPELSRKLHLEFFPHVAKHMRRTVNPPPETWTAFGPSAKGYKRYGYLALCISGAGIHARAVVKTEADNRPQMGNMLRSKSKELEKSFRGTKIQRYEKWDFANLPEPAPADASLFTALGDTLQKKTGVIDVGFGWPVREALRLERAEVLDAFRELEPLYRVLRSVA